MLVCEWCRENYGDSSGDTSTSSHSRASSLQPGTKFVQALTPRGERADVSSCSSTYPLKQKSSDCLWSSLEGRWLHLQRSFNTTYCWEPSTLFGSTHCSGCLWPPFGLICINQVLFSQLWAFWILKLQSWELKLHTHSSEFLSSWTDRVNKKRIRPPTPVLWCVDCKYPSSCLFLTVSFYS